jgi:hypothetical protein
MVGRVFRLLADLVAAMHFAFLGYAILGGFLTWRWPRSLPLHLVVVAWALVIVVLGPPCPLTGLQDWMRARAGMPALHGGFIDTYVEGVLYPARLTPLVQAGAAALVLASWCGPLVRARRRRRRDGDLA